MELETLDNDNESECPHSHEYSLLTETVNDELSSPPMIETQKSLTTRLVDVGGVGIALAFMAAMFFSTSTLMAKLVVVRYETMLIVMFRQFFQGVYTLPVNRFCNRPVYGTRRQWPWLAMRGAFGVCGISFQFLTLRFLPLGDAVVLFALGPGFATFFGRIFLKELCQVVDVLVMAFALCGVIFIAQPSFIFDTTDLEKEYSASDRLIGTGTGILSAIFMAAVVTTMRTSHVRGTHFTTVTMFYSTFCTILTPIAAAVTGALAFPSCYYDRGIFLACGLSAAFAQSCLTLATKFSPAGVTAVVMRGSEVVIAYIYDIGLLGREPNYLSIIGAATVTFCVSLLGIKGFIRQRYGNKETTSNGKFISFVLNLP